MYDDTARLKDPAIAALRRQLRGSTQLPSDAGYAVKRRVWNAAIDRHPAGIVECADAEDVAMALRIATDFGLAVTVRGGGHNVAGRAVQNGALLLDLSKLRHIDINTPAGIAMVQGGVLWHDLDIATAKHGLATTGGLISSTGVGGFTLGGGAGWLMRRHGLASDNLLAAAVLLADGRLVRASPTEHADLYWGLRGGGGGLGVATALELQLHPQREVLAGVIVHDALHAASILRSFRDFAAQAPDEFCGLAVLAHSPPFPFLDPEWYERPVVILVVCWSGDLGAGHHAIEPLRTAAMPLSEHLGILSYVQWQHMQDLSAPPYRYQYWKTASFTTLSDATLDTVAAAAQDLPTSMSAIHLQHFGGAVARIPAAGTAFANRDTQFFINIMGATPWADEFALLRERVRSLYERIARQATPGLLLPNFSNHEDGTVLEQLGADHAERLRALRLRYDPAGVFCGGQ
jgi:FAD/FMN-containing dehydrogenase